MESKAVPDDDDHDEFIGQEDIKFYDYTVGEPIPVPKIDNPTNEQLAEYQGKLLSAYETIFNAYKQEAGFGDMTLRIL